MLWLWCRLPFANTTSVSHFDNILNAVQEHDVLNKWKQQVDAMDIRTELVDVETQLSSLEGNSLKL